jgi:hypothetical protein
MTKKMKIPKRIGSVKLSKKLRKKAQKAIDMSASPFIRNVAVAAMAAAAGKAGGKRQAAGAAEAADAGAGERGQAFCGSARVHVDASNVAEAFRSAALEGLRCFMEGLDERLREQQQAREAAEAAEAAPQEASSEEEPGKEQPSGPAPGSGG